jgi:hypothetical protein
MGFKLERAFTVQPNLRNFYFVSFPLFNGLSDIADDRIPTPGNPCVGAPNGDGIVNATDAICDLWTSSGDSMGEAGFSIQKYDTSTCLFTARSAVKLPTGPDNWFYTGAFQDDITIGINREIGYLINVRKGPMDPDGSIENRAVIVGSHDPSFAGHTVSSANCNTDILSLSYHTMYRSVAEILCGLEGVDWVPHETDGFPADPLDPSTHLCPNGIFDPGGGVGLGTTVQTFDNDPGSASANLYVAFTAVSLGPGGIRFIGTNYNLQPGEAYLVSIATGVADRVFNSPHF